jgi:hypothetical protein
MTRSDIRWGDGPEWDEESLSNYERNTRILENNNQLLADVVKPWQEFADAMEESQKQVNMERTADCAQRYLYELCHAHEFAKVREILRHTHEYMTETIEVLEEREIDRLREEKARYSAGFHRSSA